jgi:hypothetical protein
MKTVTLVYLINGSRIEFVFDSMGDMLSCKINGAERIECGDAIDNALTVVTEAGHNIQRDISEAFESEAAG